MTDSTDAALFSFLLEKKSRLQFLFYSAVLESLLLPVLAYYLPDMLKVVAPTVSSDTGETIGGLLYFVAANCAMFAYFNWQKLAKVQRVINGVPATSSQ